MSENKNDGSFVNHDKIMAVYLQKIIRGSNSNEN